jgi:hypothetical protein
MVLWASLVLWLIGCAGYAGWYFGRIDGISFAQSQATSTQNIFSKLESDSKLESKPNSKSKPNNSIPTKLKTNQRNSQNGKAVISWQTLDNKTKTKHYDFSNTEQYKYSNNAHAKNTLKKLNQQIEKVQRKTKIIDRKNNNERRISQSRLPIKKVIKEKTPLCRWTLGRIGELKRIINTGGKGSKSQFCSEYDKRVFEMRKHSCLNYRRSNFGGVC